MKMKGKYGVSTVSSANEMAMSPVMLAIYWPSLKWRGSGQLGSWAANGLVLWAGRRPAGRMQ